MPAKAFFDSNIVIYSFASDEQEKRNTARHLMGVSTVVLSCQVLQECVNVLRKRMAHSPERATERVRPLLGFEVVPITLALIEEAWTLASRYGLSTYDAAIVAAARHSRCKILYSEDMQHGQMIEGVRIVNPFRIEP